MHGEGIFRWPDGREFEGLWKNGLPEGLGELKSKNGLIFRC